jgi:predicted Rossmann fold flavoprotein
MNDIIVVGAGPAGMMASIAAARHGAAVTLVEKNDRLGLKLGITGKGRCNLTAAVDKAGLIRAFSENGRFLHSAFNQFDNHNLINFFENRGLETKVERGNRVFPKSDRAHDVITVLLNAIKKAGVKVIKNEPVADILIKGGNVAGIKSQNQTLLAGAVIICTGGLSYPATGSTGEGYDWAVRAGHHIIEPQPGLVPLLADEKWIKELQGLSLKNTRATAFDDSGKILATDMGELLFTHFGLSGPIILSMSCHIGKYIGKYRQKVRLELDLKPALGLEKLDERLLRDLDKYSRKAFKNMLNDLLPQKMIPVLVHLSGIDPNRACSQVTRTERTYLAYLLKHLPVSITGTRPISEAIITVGGVNLKEIDPKTMQSKLVQGLYFAGEILDIDASTGGYNLQAAFSTGYAAGLAASERF